MMSVKKQVVLILKYRIERVYSMYDQLISEGWRHSDWYTNVLGQRERAWVCKGDTTDVIQVQMRDERDNALTESYSIPQQAFIAIFGKLLAADVDNSLDSLVSGTLKNILKVYTAKQKLTFCDSDCTDQIYLFDSIEPNISNITVGLKDQRTPSGEETSLFQSPAHLDLGKDVTSRRKSWITTDLCEQILSDLNLTEAAASIQWNAFVVVAHAISQHLPSNVSIRSILDLLFMEFLGGFKVPTEFSDEVILDAHSKLRVSSYCPSNSLITIKSRKYLPIISQMLSV